MKNAYAELGLQPGASEAEVKKAWRKLVSHWHPDRNTSAAAVSRMQRINQAFEQIRDAGFAADPAPEPPVARSARPRPAPAPTKPKASPSPSPSPAPAPAAEPPAAHRTVGRKLKLSLEEAAAGCIKVLKGKINIPCTACDGAGYQRLATACADCTGSGQQRQRAWFGFVGAAVDCEACGGSGKARQTCADCSGSRQLSRPWQLSVRIPPGVRQGDLLQVSGGQPPADHVAVNLELRIELQAHPPWDLAPDGTLHCTVKVDGFSWVAQRPLMVPTLAGPQRLQPRRDQLSYRLSGLGFPSARRGPPADLLVTVQPVYPEVLSADQQILLDQLIASCKPKGANGAA
ncbi:DnaJ domain-containing protein [Ideonella sp.]|uniref:DnaJ domain-containing protein n=1 Tax=Ideonella sp. TaxID=1929293 RepID=UPI003BB6F153